VVAKHYAHAEQTLTVDYVAKPVKRSKNAYGPQTYGARTGHD